MILIRILPCLYLAFFFTMPAIAHSALAVTIPEHEAVLAQAPQQLRFLFKAEVTLTNIRIDIIDPEKDPGDNIINQIKLELPRNSLGQSTAFGSRVDLDIPELAPANYRVVWQAMSQNGHYIVDDFDFSVMGAD